MSAAETPSMGFFGKLLNNPIGGPAALGVGAQAAGRLLGSSSTAHGSSAFDPRQIPLFMRMLGQTQQASQQAGKGIAGITQGQLGASQAGYRQLLEMLQGLGGEQLKRVGERESAARGRGRAALAQRGFRRGTLGIASDVAAARQAARERAGINEQIQGRIANVFGQGLQASNRIRAMGGQSQAALLQQNPQLLGGLVQNISQARTTTEQKKQPGLFG